MQQSFEISPRDGAHDDGAAIDAAADEELVERVLRGEAALFAILIRRYEQRLIRIVRTIAPSADDAEDVVQQAFVNAYVHLAQFAGRARFATWLSRIALNEAKARAQRGKRVGWSAPFDEEAVESADRQLDPEQMVLAGELREALERAIRSLPASHRDVFSLRQLEGLSTFETAESLGLSEDAVKTRLHRARAHLRAGLRTPWRAVGADPNALAAV